MEIQYIAVLFILMTATGLIRDLKYIAPFSLIALILTTLAIMITMYMFVQDLPPISTRPVMADFSRLPLFLGTVLFCFESIGLVSILPNIRINLRTRRHF